MLTEKELKEVLSIKLRDITGLTFNITDRYIEQIIKNFQDKNLCEKSGDEK